MNYTEAYREIYKIIARLDLPHEKVHNASLRICNALNDIYIYSHRQFPEVIDDINKVVEKYAHHMRVGGYDIDDKITEKDRIFIREDGLKNNK